MKFVYKDGWQSYETDKIKESRGTLPNKNKQPQKYGRKSDKKPVKPVILIIVLITGLLFAVVFTGTWVEKTFFYPTEYKKEVIAASDRFGTDKVLIFSVINAESGFDKNAVSKKGAAGLMQIMPETAVFIAGKLGIKTYDLFDPGTNILFGAYYLNYLLSRFGDKITAVAAYNAGEGNVEKWLKAKEYSADGKTLKSVPYPETSAYIKKIKKSLKKYKKLYPSLVDKHKKI
ncbi:MAG: lytic transglycosylase domain-containing protein [Clostridia bacterium]|nr:lytic transglycosylase domain-containing protein [Clostridia bacterium]